jgi:hypothetical protein
LPKIKKNIPLHPFLLALFPVISLWSANADYVSPEMVLRSLVLTMILAALLLLLVHLATREWLKAGVITSLILLVVLNPAQVSSARDWHVAWICDHPGIEKREDCPIRLVVFDGHEHCSGEHPINSAYLISN